jgi:ABC-type branched-subunit amino acid transport system permease subunit
MIGADRVLGPLVGALVVVLLPELLSAPQYRCCLSAYCC